MLSKLKNISLYWKCQIIGWGLVQIEPLAMYFQVLGLKKEVLIRSIIYFMLYIIWTHLMRAVIKKYKITSKKIDSQILLLLLLTIFFSIQLYLILDLFINVNSSLRKIFHQPGNTQYWNFVFGGLFSIFHTLLLWNLIYFLYHYLKNLKSGIQANSDLQIELTEMETKAILTKINPQFVFNSLTFIKSLVQNQEKEKSVNYLTTFSKLIRMVFQCTDKIQISLFDEIETCKHFLQLEKMKNTLNFNFQIVIDEKTDLKSFQIPPLIILSFIEKAIWFGIPLERNEANLLINAKSNEDYIEIKIDYDGVDKEIYQYDKSTNSFRDKSAANKSKQLFWWFNKLLKENKVELEILDKINSRGLPSGTEIILHINE